MVGFGGVRSRGGMGQGGTACEKVAAEAAVLTLDAAGWLLDAERQFSDVPVPVASKYAESLLAFDTSAVL